MAASQHRGRPSPQHPTSLRSFSSSASFSVSKALVILMDLCRDAFSSSASFMYSDSLKTRELKEWSASNCFRTDLRVTLVYIVKKGVTGKLHRDQGCYACKFYLLRGRKGLAMHRHAEPACHCVHLNSKRQVNTVGRGRSLKTVVPPPKNHSN